MSKLTTIKSIIQPYVMKLESIKNLDDQIDKLLLVVVEIQKELKFLYIKRKDLLKESDY
jgi:hypothetical protein